MGHLGCLSRPRLPGPQHGNLNLLVHGDWHHLGLCDVLHVAPVLSAYLFLVPRVSSSAVELLTLGPTQIFENAGKAVCCLTACWAYLDSGSYP